MKSVIIDIAFDGYPNGEDKAHVAFAKSDNPVDVPEEFADMIVSKGLAHVVRPKFAPINVRASDAATGEA